MVTLRSECILHPHSPLLLSLTLLVFKVALITVSLCLILGIVVFLKLNAENLTTSFSDTVRITRNPSLNLVSRNDDDSTDDEMSSRLLRFRLGELKDGGRAFGTREEMKLEYQSVFSTPLPLPH